MSLRSICKSARWKGKEPTHHDCSQNHIAMGSSFLLLNNQYKKDERSLLSMGLLCMFRFLTELWYSAERYRNPTVLHHILVGLLSGKNVSNQWRFISYSLYVYLFQKLKKIIIIYPLDSAKNKIVAPKRKPTRWLLNGFIFHVMLSSLFWSTNALHAEMLNWISMQFN